MHKGIHHGPTSPEGGIDERGVTLAREAVRIGSCSTHHEYMSRSVYWNQKEERIRNRNDNLSLSHPSVSASLDRCRHTHTYTPASSRA